MASSTGFAMAAYNTPHLRAALALPEGLHVRTRALAEQWRQSADFPESLIKMALNHFNQAPFITL